MTGASSLRADVDWEQANRRQRPAAFARVGIRLAPIVAAALSLSPKRHRLCR